MRCEYAGYDHRFEFGNGGHSLRHGGALFADSLRWLWRNGENVMTARFTREHIEHGAATAWRESSGSSTPTR